MVDRNTFFIETTVAGLIKAGVSETVIEAVKKFFMDTDNYADWLEGLKAFLVNANPDLVVKEVTTAIDAFPIATEPEVDPLDNPEVPTEPEVDPLDNPEVPADEEVAKPKAKKIAKK